MSYSQRVPLGPSLWLSDQSFSEVREADPLRLADRQTCFPEVFALSFELFAITTVGRAAGAAVAEKIFFGRHFKLLKVEY